MAEAAEKERFEGNAVKKITTVIEKERHLKAVPSPSDTLSEELIEKVFPRKEIEERKKVVDEFGEKHLGKTSEEIKKEDEIKRKAKAVTILASEVIGGGIGATGVGLEVSHHLGAAPAFYETARTKVVDWAKGLFTPIFIKNSEGELTADTKITTQETTPVTILPKVIVPTETTVQEIVPPTTEVIKTGPVEYEGVMINPIEGLRFDNGTFFAQEGNPYGLEAETKAGVFIIDAFKLNGEKKNAMGFVAEVLDYKQKKMAKENHELRFPIPVDLEKAKGVKIDITESKYYSGIDSVKEQSLENEKITFLGIKFDDFNQEIFVYTPVETRHDNQYDGFTYGPVFGDKSSEEQLDFSFTFVPANKLWENTLWKNYKVQNGELDFVISGAELILDKPLVQLGDQRYLDIGPIGLKLLKVKQEPSQEIEFMSEGYSIFMQYRFVQWEWDEANQKWALDKRQLTGESIIMETENMPTFVLSAHEK